MRRLLKWLGAFALAVVVLVFGSRALAAWERGRERTLPAPTGPYTVGRRSLFVRDSSRSDPLAADSSAVRELFAWVWYPARRGAKNARAEYLPSAWRNALRRLPRGQRLDRVHGNALDGPPVADTVFPLLLFSPGLGVLPSNYTALLEDIASHGYIIVAVAHPYNTSVVVFPDGRVVRSRGERPIRYDRVVSVLAADMVSVLNHASREGVRGDPVLAHADTQRVGIFGHSFGGATAAQACGLDARFKAGIDLDGTIFGPVRTSGIAQPFMLMMADLGFTQRFRKDPFVTYIARDQARRHEESFVAHSPAASWVNVKHLTHMNFTDEAHFYSLPFGLLELVGARMNGRETQAIASAYVRSFFGRHLSGVESPARELERPDGDGLTWVARAKP